MEMIRQEAIEDTLAIWRLKAKSGRESYTGSDKCPLCIFAKRNCFKCPYFQVFEGCSPLLKRWHNAETLQERREYASQIVAQLEEL